MDLLEPENCFADFVQLLCDHKSGVQADSAPLVLVQGVLSEEFKASEIEVGVVRSNFMDRSFHVLSNEEVETHLSVISERD